MWATEPVRVNENGLDALAAAGGAVLAVLLLLGGTGHLSAVWPTSDESTLSQLLPGLLLLAAGAFNAVAAVGLLRRRAGWQWAALVVNLGLAIYLAWLLTVGVPDHPIGVFLALVCSQLIVLGAVLVGLEWRAPDP